MASDTPPAVRRRRPRRTAAEMGKTLVFISHDSRDHALAEAFENLLKDASGGVLRTFRSSDKSGQSGIAFGADWYATVMQRLREATDVVALITKHSIDRPWILYEVGVARGRSGVTAFGVVLQVPLHQIGGPFAQLQNSPDDEGSLTKLVMQLIGRIPGATPRAEAVRLLVNNFRAQVATVSPQLSVEPQQPQTPSILFEEVKAMFRIVSDQISALRPHSPPEANKFEEELPQIPAIPKWATEIYDLLGQAQFVRHTERRLILWRKVSSLVSKHLPVRPPGLSTISEALRLNNLSNLLAGVAELRQHVQENARNVKRDHNAVPTDAILSSLADLAVTWSQARR
jgi:hypothetical protein